jgi:hypothetical protein
MTSFNVLYAGQLRFVECVQYHKTRIAGAESIDAVFVDSVFDKWQTNIGSKHSINNLSFKESLDFFKQTINPNSCVVADLQKYSKLIDVNRYRFFIYQQLFLMLDHLTENDVVFFLTPEIVFNSETSLTLKEIADTVTQGAPKAFAWVTDSNMLQNHFVYFNRAGVCQLKERWKQRSFLNVGDMHIENLWYKIINDCGVEVVPSELSNMSNYCLRFKNNMDFDKISNYNYLNEQRRQWTILREGV